MELIQCSGGESAPLLLLTPLAFISRFSDEEAIAIDLASIGATPQAAAMRRYQQKMTLARAIDLLHPDTRNGVHALEKIGLLAEGRALQILDTPISPHEQG
jgi:hypothetical protein